MENETGRVEIKLLHYGYFNNEHGPVLICKGRDKLQKPHIFYVFDMEHLAPRFGILKSERYIAEKLQRFSIEIKDGPKSLYGEETLRVFVKFPWEVPKLRDEFSWTFEADVKWGKMAISEIIRICGLESPYISIPKDYPYKYLNVNDIQNLPEEKRFKVVERVCCWDIETDTRNCSGQSEAYKDARIAPIISIACHDNYPNIYYRFVWHPDFKDFNEEVLLNYNIIENDKKITIPKLITYKYPTEKQMLKDFFLHVSLAKYDIMLGYYSEGGYKKLGKRKVWNNGYDSPLLYERSVLLGLQSDIQKISPFGIVYSRNTGGKYETVIDGMGQIDWVFSNEILQVDQRYYDFRGGRLADWMAYFTNFYKLDKEGRPPVWFWLNDMKFLLDYNVIDVYGLVELNKKFDITGKQRGRADVSISPLEDGIMASKLHDHAKLTLYKERFAFDTKYYDNKHKRNETKGKAQIGEKFTITLKDLEAGMGEGKHYTSLYDIHKVGGHVPIPLERGVYENIVVLDFEKFYPNMIKSTNSGILPLIDLDKEYWFCITDKQGNVYDRKTIIETPMAYYRKDIKSLNSEIFDLWLGKRVEAQRKLKEYVAKYKTTKTEEYERLWVEQFNLKNFMNAYFGILGLPVDRGYSKLGLNTCTVSCQDVIKMCINTVRSWGYIVIGGDTDSMFLKLKTSGLDTQIKEANDLVDMLNVVINEYLDRVYNIQEHTIKLGVETISDKFYVDVKKHYIKRNLYVDGVILEKPELDIKGMDLKKRATSQIAAELQKNLINYVFYDKEPLEKISEHITDVDSKLETMEWDYLCKRGPLQKRLDKYPDTNESATAAKNAVKYLGLEFKAGDNPFLGVFKKFPRKINGYFVEERDGLKLSFYKENIPKLKELGFELDYDNIRETQCNKKTEHILGIFNEDWYSLVESGTMGDMMLI